MVLKESGIMKVNIFPLVSSLHKLDVINDNTKFLLKELMEISDIEFIPKKLIKQW